MRILFLGGNLAFELAEWLKNQGDDVVYTEQKLDLNMVKEHKPDMIISYNYKYLLTSEIIKYPESGCINLHISLLPWNRGAHPNVWSFLEDTPKGVTIHYIDEGIDTGNIIIQKEIFIDENKETLQSSYKILHREIQALFKENWKKIKNNELIPQPQEAGGSIHFKKEFAMFEPFIKQKGWNIPVRQFKERYNSNLKLNTDPYDIE